ncbi:intraflagellar transport protein 27 homolog [Hydractinia symbiolongicarpus]|uniref:intraflagellar transport protein 27 homolog n=1 Tax=Hydractinia symbiolongicarpus TaxID=13093 RepID=UPI00254A562C|nr:intraflagellar transport protein 27 homolog [Hydractinia symbiolongicarpus]
MPEEKKKLNFRGKCVICGDSTVGKSALTQVYCSDGAQYPKTYLMTTGVDLVVKSVNIPETPHTVEMFLYDTAGKDVFQDIVDAHLQNVEMAIFVYDVTNQASYDNIRSWHKKVEAANSGKLFGVLVANKCDLTDRQVVSNEMGEDLASQLQMKIFHTSAKEMHDVESPFQQVVADFFTACADTSSL